jgi:Flp pilus assembly protein TadB
MSKERARRRAAREHEAGLRRAARAAEQERRARRAARGKAIRAVTTDRVRLTPVGRPTGTLARRRRTQRSMLVALLLCLNIVVWVVRPDWEARLAAVVVSVLAFPVLRLLLFSHR